jgi:hypothetical protein
MCIVNDSTLGIYKNNGNAFWDRIATLEAPPSAYPFRFFGSPEPFVVNGKTFVSFVLKTVYTNSSYVDAEVWVMDLEPNINNRFMLRCDDGLPSTKRTDPESYIGTNEVFIYYNQINSLGEFEIWRNATGISTTTTGINETLFTQTNVTIFPNPTSGNVFMTINEQKLKSVKIYNLIGELLQEHFTSEFSVSNLPSGLYFVTIQTDKSTFTKKLIKQ